MEIISASSASVLSFTLTSSKPYLSSLDGPESRLLHVHEAKAVLYSSTSFPRMPSRVRLISGRPSFAGRIRLDSRYLQWPSANR